MRYWDDYLEQGGVREDAIAALAEDALGIKDGPGNTTRAEMLRGWPRLQAMTREQLTAVPGLTEADVEQVHHVLHNRDAV
jgi:hypothetical protein